MTNWDQRFLDMAKLVASWSKDPSTKVGAVIVRPNRSVASVGFNGFPQSMPDSAEYYADRQEKYSRTVHAEVNATLFAREPVRGYTLYTYPFACCDRCAAQMIQAGITRFVFPKPTADVLSRWADSIMQTYRFFDECSVEYKEMEQ